MKKLMLIAIMIFNFVLVYSADNNYTLERSVVTDLVEQREPNLPLDSFSLYSKGYYFTEFRDIGEEKTIFHNWYYLGEGDEEILTASIPLEIAGFRWRTWSIKNLYLPGQWKVEAVDEKGTIISTESFSVE